MKYFNYLCIAAFALLLCCACEKQDEGTEPPVVTEEPDYLVMYYGIGGGTLDLFINGNIFQALDAGGDGKVVMTFQYKASAKWQEDHPAIDGTRRFTSEENAHLKGQLKSYSDLYPMLQWDKCDDLYAQLKSEKIGDADYDMVCSDSLTAFIKWSKEKYPKAKRTILVMAGHGRGWAIGEDAKTDTRAILKDDNTKTFMSMNAVVNGVKNAGNVDLIYDDACLMGMYETLYAYADCAKYLLASMEATPEQGGEYITFINLLKEAGTTDGGLEEAMHKHCDHCVNDWWPKSTYYFDIGFYNLTKLNSSLTPALKNTVETLVNKFESNESIDPSKEGALPLGDSFGNYIRKAFMNCEIVDAHIIPDYGAFTDLMYERMEKDNVKKSEKEEVMFWLSSIYQAQDIEDMTLKVHVANAVEYTSYQSENSFSLTDLLRNLDNSLIEVGARNNPFGPLRKELISALKDVSYIKCVTPKPHTGIDEEYELCSPGILIMPMQRKYYDVPVYSRHNYEVSPTNALEAYKLTAFDCQIGWSRMLEKLDVSPSFITNPTRGYVK